MQHAKYTFGILKKEDVFKVSCRNNTP